MPDRVATTRLLLSLILLALAPLGCARYEYDIVEPPELAQHVGTKQWVTLDRDPLQYRLQSVESRLVMQIHNPTQDPIQIVGDKSVLVDPLGESHALKSQTIAPQSFVKLILPPMALHVERSGPTFGFGVGIGSGYPRYPGYGYGYRGAFYDPWYDEPHYYAIVDPNDNTYWEWSGEGNVRLTLAFSRGEDVFTQSFVIGRQKM